MGVGSGARAAAAAAGEQTLAYVVGEIICIAMHEAGAEFNPYGLPTGTVFYVLDAHALAMAGASVGGGGSSAKKTAAAAGGGDDG